MHTFVRRVWKQFYKIVDVSTKANYAVTVTASWYSA